MLILLGTSLRFLTYAIGTAGTTCICIACFASTFDSKGRSIMRTVSISITAAIVHLTAI